jgi:sec-independent protein translocase protein TatA
MNISKELIIGLIIAFFIFGPSRLAGLGGALGKTIRDFKKSFDGSDEVSPPPSQPSDAPKS